MILAKPSQWQFTTKCMALCVTDLAEQTELGFECIFDECSYGTRKDSVQAAAQQYRLRLDRLWTSERAVFAKPHRQPNVHPHCQSSNGWLISWCEISTVAARLRAAILFSTSCGFSRQSSGLKSQATAVLVTCVNHLSQPETRLKKKTQHGSFFFFFLLSMSPFPVLIKTWRQRDTFHKPTTYIYI